jgi:hypothetical protein
MGAENAVIVRSRDLAMRVDVPAREGLKKRDVVSRGSAARSSEDERNNVLRPSHSH